MTRPALLLVIALPMSVGAAWTLFAGKDVNWDLLNYHYYLPYELLGGRLQQDFFAASAQSYLNPVGYVPFYAMVSAGWHSIGVSTLLACFHALSLSLLFLIAWRLFAHRTGAERAVFACLACLLGAATAVFWPTVGTSFLDPLLVPPMLAGLLLLLEGGSRPVARAALAGALFGAAAALKYSNALYGLAALGLAFCMPLPAGASRLRPGLAYIAGGALALALLAGPWFVLLMREFGNPVFPLMNGWFQSPHAPAVNMVSERFTPKGLIEALGFPLRMMALDRHVYSEILAPDLRFAALVMAAAALPVVALLRREPAGKALRGADWRLLAFFSASALLWLASSANARYGLVVLLLAGVALARLAERVLDARGARIALAALLAVQAVMCVVASPPRWFLSEPWSQRWLPYDPPERALREPALYLSLELLPMAVVAPFLHPASAFVNFRGQHSLPSDSPRLAALLERHRGRVRVLGRGLELVEGRPDAVEVTAYDTALRRIGYRLDPDDCFTIPWRREPDDALSRFANRLAGRAPAPEPLSVASCALVAAARDPADLERERRASAAFERIEKACPALLRGQSAATETFGSGWSRNYGGLDARLEAYGDRVFFHRYRSATLIDLGRLSDWERGIGACLSDGASS